MSINNIDYSLYVVTDRELMSTSTVEKSVELSIKGGATVIQLREKNISSREFYDTALKVKEITAHYNVPLIINDRLDIALAVDADGVHIGQEDIPAKEVRKIIGFGKILGVSAGNLHDALKARTDGADYLGVGAMYSTDTKTDADLTSVDELKEIRKNVDIPIVVIGGINHKTAPNFAETGIDGLAVVSAVVAQDDIEAAARELKSIFIKEVKA